MTQFTLTIENKDDVSLIRKILKKFEGVTLSPVRPKKKTAYEEAMEDIVLPECFPAHFITHHSDF